MSDNEPYVPTNLKLWKLPRYYMGAHWDGYYVAPVGRSRDSETIEQSNWRVQLKELGGESEDGESVVVVREGHFLVGWVEWVAIRSDAHDALRVADKLAQKLDVYPILSEDDLSQLEWEQEEANASDDDDDDDEPLARDESVARGQEQNGDPGDEDLGDGVGDFEK